MWAALRTCPHIHSPGDYDYDDDEDHLATYTLDGTHTLAMVQSRQSSLTKEGVGYEAKPCHG